MRMYGNTRWKFGRSMFRKIGFRYRDDRTWATPIVKPPMTAPPGESSPPRMAAGKALSAEKRTGPMVKKPASRVGTYIAPAIAANAPPMAHASPNTVAGLIPIAMAAS